MKILIAGATGAIGTPLTRALLATGHEVVHELTALTKPPVRHRDMWQTNRLRTDAALLRRRKVPIPANGNGPPSWIHIDDAAGATVVAIENGQAGSYNIVDDHATLHQGLRAMEVNT